MPHTPRTLRTLMTDLIDYAGLFPPAKLGMAEAVETYNRVRMSDKEWMLGRFICPVSRLREFEQAAGALLPGTQSRSGYRDAAVAGSPWLLSVLMDGEPAKDLDAIDAFNARHADADRGLADIDQVEVRISEAGQVDALLEEIPEDLFPFFEFPLTTDCRGFVAALAGEEAGAKIRTGGVVGNAFPMVDEVAAFLHACAAAGVRFKATAGLHHAVRGNYRLTYEKDSQSCVMHGFLNLFIAAAFAKVQRPDPSVTSAILRGEDPADFKFSEEVLGWKNHLLAVTDLAVTREEFAISYGSCSFDEPTEELGKMGLL